MTNPAQLTGTTPLKLGTKATMIVNAGDFGKKFRLLSQSGGFNRPLLSKGSQKKLKTDWSRVVALSQLDFLVEKDGTFTIIEGQNRVQLASDAVDLPKPTEFNCTLFTREEVENAGMTVSELVRIRSGHKGERQWTYDHTLMVYHMASVFPQACKREGVYPKHTQSPQDYYAWTHIMRGILTAEDCLKDKTIQLKSFKWKEEAILNRWRDMTPMECQNYARILCWWEGVAKVASAGGNKSMWQSMWVATAILLWNENFAKTASLDAVRNRLTTKNDSLDTLTKDDRCSDALTHHVHRILRTTNNGRKTDNTKLRIFGIK